MVSESEAEGPPAERDWQGLTLVHFSAQCKRFLWDRGCIWGSLRGCLGGTRGCKRVFRV